MQDRKKIRNWRNGWISSIF